MLTYLVVLGVAAYFPGVKLRDIARTQSVAHVFQTPGVFYVLVLVMLALSVFVMAWGVSEIPRRWRVRITDRGVQLPPKRGRHDFVPWAEVQGATAEMQTGGPVLFLEHTQGRIPIQLDYYVDKAATVRFIFDRLPEDVARPEIPKRPTER